MPEKLTFEFDLSLQVKQAFIWHLPYVKNSKFGCFVGKCRVVSLCEKGGGWEWWLKLAFGGSFSSALALCYMTVALCIYTQP